MILEYTTAYLVWLNFKTGIGRALTDRERINFRELRNYFLTLFFWLLVIFGSIFLYINDPHLPESLGLYYFRLIDNDAVFYVYYILLAFFVAILKPVLLYKERKHQVAMMKMLEMIKWRRDGLNDKYWRKMSWSTSPIIDIGCKLSTFAAYLLLLSNFGLFAFLFYSGQLEKENYYFDAVNMGKIITLQQWQILSQFTANIIASIVFWYILATLLNGFLGYYFSSKFLQYRFDQLMEKFTTEMKNETLTVGNVRDAILEHNYLAGLVNENNSMMNIALFIVYFIVSTLADVTIYQAIYVNTNWLLKSSLILIAICVPFFLFQCAYSSACLFKSAHSLYAPLNSIMAKCVNLRLRRRLAISFYIERFGGPPITTYVYDLFGLTNYEFYLFIAAIASNFFLLVDLFKQDSDSNTN